MYVWYWVIDVYLRVAPSVGAAIAPLRTNKGLIDWLKRGFQTFSKVETAPKPGPQIRIDRIRKEQVRGTSRVGHVDIKSEDWWTLVEEFWRWSCQTGEDHRDEMYHISSHLSLLQDLDPPTVDQIRDQDLLTLLSRIDQDISDTGHHPNPEVSLPQLPSQTLTKMKMKWCKFLQKWLWNAPYWTNYLLMMVDNFT